MDVFDHSNYKAYVLDRIRSMPRHGRGQLMQLAKLLKVNTSLISQIFRGEKDLTSEQASLVCDHFGLTELEADYFMTLVSLERAGNPSLRRRLTARRNALKARAGELSARIPASRQLDEEQKAIFYSNWFYSAARLISAIDGMSDVDSIAEALSIPKGTANTVIRFLLGNGLCVEENGRIRMGPARTHVPSTSPLVTRHHTNWRLKALETMDRGDPEDLFFTSPMTLSTEDVKKVRKILLESVQNVSAVVDPSPSERLVCLNIDLFRLF